VQLDEARAVRSRIGKHQEGPRMAYCDEMHRLVWDYHRAVRRRDDEVLSKVAYAIDLWLGDVFRGPLPADWREQFRDVLAEQAAEGRRVVPHSAQNLERWIAWWAGRCGMLPRQQPEMQHWQRWRLAQQRAAALGRPFQLASYAVKPPAGRRQTQGGAARASDRQERAVDLTGKPESAGPGPQTPRSFQDKVRLFLKILDPDVAAWWASTGGILQSRDATSWSKFLRKNYYSERQKDRPTVVVDMNFTAAEAAHAIVAEAHNSDASSAGPSFRKFTAFRRDTPTAIAQWQKEAFRLSRQQAALLAELYYAALASLSSGGDLVLTVNEVAEDGLSWRQIFYLLPFVSVFGKHVKTITIRIVGKGSKGTRTIKLSADLGDDLAKLDPAKKKALLDEAYAAKTDDEAVAIIERGVGRGARAAARVKPPFPPPVAAVRARPIKGKSAPHPSHVRAAESEEALARSIHHDDPNEVVILWGKPIGANGPDIISYNLETKVVTLWDDKFRSELRRIRPSTTFGHGTDTLEKSIRDAMDAIRDSRLAAADKDAALRSIERRNVRTITRGSGRSRNSTFRYQK
jgi:hypothetical protein